MVIQGRLACAGCHVKPVSEQDWMTYWGPCSYSFSSQKKCYTCLQLVPNTRGFIVFQMLWNAWLNTMHLLSLLAKSNHPVSADSALTTVTHFLNEHWQWRVKPSACQPIQPKKLCKPRIHANSVPIKPIVFSSSYSVPRAILQDFQYLWQVKESPQLLRQRQERSTPITGALRCAKDTTSVWEGIRPSTRNMWGAKPPTTSRSQLLHLKKSKAILLTSSDNKD